LRVLSLPALAMLLGRGTLAAETAAPAGLPWPRALPHEQWLARALGLANRQAAGSRQRHARLWPRSRRRHLVRGESRATSRSPTAT
jgi:hypothetical protein